jgi:hypothetical protein
MEDMAPATKKPSPRSADTPKPSKASDFPTYQKGSAEAADFRSAFASARKSGEKEFTWQGRRYNTKTK